MRTCKGLMMMLLSCLIHAGAQAQQSQQIQGTVLSTRDNAPVEGAVISSPGAEGTARTDTLGQFTLKVNSLDGEIRVEAPGYQEIIHPLSGRTNISVALIPESPYSPDPHKNPLNTFTESVHRSGFRPGALYVEDALQSAFPGLQVVNKSGMPGEGAYLNLRGIRSLVGDNTPLVVVNGVPYMPDMHSSPVVGGFSRSIFNTINLNNVENITLLKGAGASLYGSLGANGVLLIETTRASEFETVVEFSGQYGVAMNNARMPVLNVADFKSYIGDIGLTHYEDMGVMLETFPFLIEDPEYYYTFLYNNNTDWQSHIYRTAAVTDNNLRIKGGDNIARYDLSVGVLNQNGTLENTFMSRYNTRLNASITLSRNIELFSSVGLAYINSRQHEQGLLGATNPVLAAMHKAPILNPYKKDEFNHQLPIYDIVRQFNVSNPLAVINDIEMETSYSDLFLNTGLNYQVSEHLKLIGVFGLFSNYTRQTGFIPGKSSASIVPLEAGVALNTARSGVGKTSNNYYSLSARYERSLGLHQLDAGVGYRALFTRQEFDAGKGRNTSSDFYTTLSYVDNEGRNFWGYIDLWNWMNTYGYADYTFDDLLTASVRVAVDGSSSSGASAPRFGVFPSGSLTWKAKNMAWLKDRSSISALNIRAGYSVTGNSHFSSDLSKQYYISQIYRELSGIVRGNIANTALKWETSQTLEAGVDLSLFDYRLRTSVDFYHTATKDVIIPEKISPVFGIDYRYANLGEISNKGVEIGLQLALVESADAGFSLGGTFASTSNVLESLGGQPDRLVTLQDGSTIISSVDKAPYSFYGYVTDGVFSSRNEAEAAGLVDYKGALFQAGDIRFKDLNGDGIINDEDRTVLGDGTPDFFGGFYAHLRYKNLSLSANFSYSYGNMAYNAMRRETESMNNFYNQSTAVNRRWQTEGQVTDIPKATYGDPMQNSRFSDRWIEDASYLRLACLTLNYQINSPVLKYIKGGNIYVTGENLFTLTDYLGNDPVNSYSYDPMRQGVDYGKLALPLVVKVGFNLQF